MHVHPSEGLSDLGSPSSKVEGSDSLTATLARRSPGHGNLGCTEGRCVVPLGAHPGGTPQTAGKLIGVGRWQGSSSLGRRLGDLPQTSSVVSEGSPL